MSIILKGIDLPKGYKALHMRVQSDGVVRYVIEGDDPVHIIDGACAIQIPKGHGRLIDADALELEKEVELADDWKTAHKIANCVKYAPTILEAKE